MRSVLLVNVLDWARSLGADPEGATPESVANFLETEYLRSRGGGFNYDTSMRSTYDLFRGAIDANAAIAYCRTNGNPVGRAQNVDAIEAIAEFASSNISTCYKTGFVAVPVGRIAGKNVYVGIKAPFVRVCHNEAFLVVPGYRKTHRPAEREIDAACSLVLAQLARDDFAEADFEYLYAGPGHGSSRICRAIHGRDRETFDRDAVDAFVDIYVKGVALVLSRGKGTGDPNFRGYRIFDPNQQGLFK